MGYRRFLNCIAKKELVKKPEIPDFKLMVGEAENLTPLPLVIYKKGIPKEVAPIVGNVAQLSSEEIAKKLSENTLEVNDMCGNVATIGSALGGV